MDSGTLVGLRKDEKRSPRRRKSAPSNVNNIMDYNRFERITGHNELGAQTATIYKELGKIRTATTRMIHIIDLNHI